MVSNKNNNILEKALEVFKNTSKNVEAYKKFLKKYKVSPQSILRKKDFEGIPIMDKSNYLLAFRWRL